jgi:hypothetical protein
VPVVVVVVLEEDGGMSSNPPEVRTSCIASNVPFGFISLETMI